MFNLRRILSLLVCLTGLGCEDDIRSTATPEIVVEPASLVFPGPEPGSDFRALPVTVRNIGKGNLLIASAAVTENDPVTEFFLEDAEDWSGAVRTVLPDSEVVLTISWRVRDNQADSGALTIVHNAGDDLVVPLSTLDLDPNLTVRTDPMGAPGEGELTVTLEDATSTTPQRVEIVVESRSVAPLVLDDVCLISGGNNCVDGEPPADWIYWICDGAPDSFVGCVAPTVAAPIGFGETKTLSVFFRPPAGSGEVHAARVLIASNAAANPTFGINLRGQRCVRAAAEDVCGGCGDGEVNGAEACDDGNFDDGDGCRNDCTATRCGDGQVDPPGEACDDGNDDDTDDCVACAEAVCGDGAVWAENEACDDGNDVDGDGCDGNCTPSACGNGVAAPDEECDDGNNVSGDGCDPGCLTTRCGNGVVSGDEACDDGNDLEGDGCDSNCTLSACGNGVVGPGEACDDGNQVDGDGCDRGCVPSGCGNNVVSAGEECDDGNAETETCEYGEPACAVCRADCTIGAGVVLRCGDGRTDGPEACDDGDDLDTNACTTDCQAARCGDGHVFAGEEECDEGGVVEDACEYGVRACRVCRAGCRLGAGTATFCGDGELNGPEECDGGDNCNADCTAGPVRGDGDYGDPCECGNDCASGLCLDSGRDGGRCTALCDDRDDCPDIDLCLDATYPRPTPGCPDPGLDFEVGDPIRLCAPNETGLDCGGANQCRFSAACLTPPNPLPHVPPSQLCGAACDADEHCPAGYRCDFINIAGQGFNLCQPAVEISLCPDGTNRACGGVCPLEAGERDEDVAHCIVVDGRAPGYCACSCRDASDCPQGFGCGRRVFDTDDPQRPGVCLPVAGFICPEGPNGSAACLSLACYDAPEDDRPPQCVTICDRRADCPEDYACRAVPGEGINVCLPQ